MREPSPKMNDDTIFVILSAPSGAGKTTIARTFIEKHPNFRFSISATTRQPRGSEQDGVDYYFKTPEAFKEMIANRELVEWAEVHGNMYGTPVATIEKAYVENKHVIFDIDVQGGLQVKQRYPHQTILLFVMPPSKKILTERLIGRSTDSKEIIEKRLKNAEKEITIGFEHYEYVIVNDTVEKAVAALEEIVEGFSHKLIYNREVFGSWQK